MALTDSGLPATPGQSLPATPFVESERVQVMQVLDLLLDVAYHDGNDRDLAVAAEAYTLAGYHDGAIMVSHSGTHDDLMKRVAIARFRRHKRLLRQSGLGLLRTVEVLIHEGLIEGREASFRQNERWKERGGHGR